MKFLTDENVAETIVNGLRKTGYDVKDIKEEGQQRTKDIDVLMLANKENRILITNNKDFVTHYSFSNVKHHGIILLKFKKQVPSNMLDMLLSALNSKIANKLSNNLTIITEQSVTVHKK